MSPITIMCALEFHFLANPVEDGTYSTNPEGIRQASRAGLIEEYISSALPTRLELRLTEKGRAYVDFLQNMPLPEAEWKIPA